MAAQKVCRTRTLLLIGSVATGTTRTGAMAVCWLAKGFTLRIRLGVLTGKFAFHHGLRAGALMGTRRVAVVVA